MPEEDDYINDAGTGENAQDIDPEVIDDYYNDNNNSSGSGGSDNTGGTGDEDPTPSEDDIFNDELQNFRYNPPKPSEKWQKFQRVATVLGLASAIVTLIYFITKISSK
jgi:hypothetical protein